MKRRVKKRREYGFWNVVIDNLKTGSTYKAKDYLEARQLYMKGYVLGKKIRVTKSKTGYLCTRVRG